MSEKHPPEKKNDQTPSAPEDKRKIPKLIVAIASPIVVVATLAAVAGVAATALIVLSAFGIGAATGTNLGEALLGVVSNIVDTVANKFDKLQQEKKANVPIQDLPTSPGKTAPTKIVATSVEMAKETAKTTGKPLESEKSNATAADSIRKRLGSQSDKVPTSIPTPVDPKKIAQGKGGHGM